MSLSAPQLKDAQKAVFSATNAVQTYVTTILTQADIKLDELPNLPTVQKAARKNAQAWSETVLPSIIKSNADIIDCANQFSSFYPTLVALAKKIDAGDKTQLQKFAQGLVLLRNNVASKEAHALNTASQVTALKDLLSGDYENFQKQTTLAVKDLEGDDGDIEEISSEIDKCNKQISDAIGLMAGSSTSEAIGIVMIFVGVFAEIPTAGFSTVLVVGGIGFFIGGFSAQIAGAVEYGRAVGRKKELQDKLAADKQAIGIIKHVLFQLNGFGNQMSSAVGKLSALREQWGLLSKSLNQVISDVEKPLGSIVSFEAMLDKAKVDWQNALNLAIQMQSSGNLPVQKVDNILDVIHTSTKSTRAP